MRRPDRHKDGNGRSRDAPGATGSCSMPGLQHGLSDQIAMTIEHILFGPGYPEAAAWKEKWRAMSAANLRGAFGPLAHRDDIGDKVSAIRVPTLIIHGDADAAIPLAKAKAMQAFIPNAELVVAEGGHSVNTTNPAAVNPLIEFSWRGTASDRPPQPGISRCNRMARRKGCASSRRDRCRTRPSISS